MLDRRLQILVDGDRWSRLAREARRRQVSVAVLVREAIDERFPSDDSQRRAALQVVLDAPPVELPPPEQLRRELEEIRTQRG